MTKKLLPTMIGAFLAGGMAAAQADVTVFGHIDESVLSWDAEAKVSYDDGEFSYSDKDDADDLNLRCTTCSIGFKGSEDLGNGLKAVFKLDFQYDINNRNKGDQSGSITDRDQWVGLAGNFGQVAFGTMSTTYKAHGAMIDPLYRTVVQARDIGLQSSLHSGAGEEGEGRADNTIGWSSPDWNGLKVGVTYTLDSHEYDGRDDAEEDNDPFGIGASYENGGILVFADYLTNDGNGDETQSELEAWKVGGKYAMDNFSVFGQYESMENDWATLADDVTLNWGMVQTITGMDRNDISNFFFDEDAADVAYDNETTVWHIGGTYTMGNNTIYAAYGQSEAELSSPEGGSGRLDIDGDFFTIAGIHSLSKQTLVYAGYTMVENDIDDNAGVLSSTSLDVDAFTAGIKHKF